LVVVLTPLLAHKYVNWGTSGFLLAAVGLRKYNITNQLNYFIRTFYFQMTSIKIYLFICLCVSGMLGLETTEEVLSQSNNHCPTNCSCSTLKDHRATPSREGEWTRLTIDCRNRTGNDSRASEALVNDINNTLSAINNLSWLNITNSILSEIPMEICNKVCKKKWLQFQT